MHDKLKPIRRKVTAFSDLCCVLKNRDCSIYVYLTLVGVFMAQKKPEVCMFFGFAVVWWCIPVVVKFN